MHRTNEFLDHDHRMDTKEQLQFRSYEQVVKGHNGVGLSVRACYRNWSREVLKVVHKNGS